LFSRTKDQIPKNEKSGVYSLTCSDCGAIYIGETSRPLHRRLSEHIDAFLKKQPQKSAMAEHLLTTNHNPEKVIAKLLHVEKSFHPCLTLEHIEIIKIENKRKF